MTVALIILSIICLIQAGINFYLLSRILSEQETESQSETSITDRLSHNPTENTESRRTESNFCWQCRNDLGSTIGCDGCERYLERQSH